MKIKITNHKTPTLSQLTGSIWLREKGQAFVPTRLFKGGKWYLVELGDPANGYTSLGQGWETVTEMFKDVGEQFQYLVPVDTATVNSPDIVKL